VIRKYDKMQCVAKIIIKNIDISDSDDRALFEKELQVLKLANHPFHIEFIENFEYKKKKYCIITKLATGGDLRKLINKKKDQ
jgi:serine/threonine protein kinase